MVGEKLDSQMLYDQLVSIEKQNRAIETAIQLIKDEMLELIDENRSLKIENTYLREKLDALGKVKENLDEFHAQTVGMSNLETLYQSGVHICHNFYGAKREEMCLLCETLLSHQQED